MRERWETLDCDAAWQQAVRERCVVCPCAKREEDPRPTPSLRGALFRDPKQLHSSAAHRARRILGQPTRTHGAVCTRQRPGKQKPWCVHAARGGVSTTTRTAAEMSVSQTLYAQSLNQKVKKHELKRALHLLFSAHGVLLDLVVSKKPKCVERRRRRVRRAAGCRTRLFSLVALNASPASAEAPQQPPTAETPRAPARCRQASRPGLDRLRLGGLLHQRAPCAAGPAVLRPAACARPLAPFCHRRRWLRRDQ